MAARDKTAGLVDITLRKAKVKDLDDQLSKLEGTYQIYKSLRKVTGTPGDLSIDYEIKGKRPSKGSGISRESLRSDAAKYRILRAIKEHVAVDPGEAQTFDLDFHLKCRDIPDVYEYPEVETGKIDTGKLGGEVTGGQIR
jgi:hypothetical protein